jgi:nitrite reductase/ring-hydroxylating ferredoxin subunit/multimeric flavodoxin WrbA
MSGPKWHDLGSAEELARHPLQTLAAGNTKLALIYKDGQFSALSGVCNHAGGPIGDGRIDGDYVVCPWHNWKYHCRTGLGEPGYEADAVPRYEVKVENMRVLVNLTPATKRTHGQHEPHPLARPVKREPGSIRVVGVSTTAMDSANPRYSTSDALLMTALEHAQEGLGLQTRHIRLNDLSFRHCEGYYSKSARACTWPCSITQMDAGDQMGQVYEAFVHWADVIVVSTPIRWGAASSLYYKMVERMNCIQNQETIANKILMCNKTAAFIITGGQDNVQAVAGQMLGFFAEIGCQFPPFPYIAHSRGWSAEDMERNVQYVQRSQELHDGARALIDRAVESARVLLEGAGERLMTAGGQRMPRGGRKAHELDVKAQI